MSNGRWVLVVAVLLSTLGWLANRAFFTQPEVEVTSLLGEEIVVMRTRGGWLEVSTIRSTETFEGTVPHEILGIQFDPTIARIRVPAHFSYRIPLATEWKVLRKAAEFVVIAPRVEPALPVAVDLSKIQKYASGTWSLLTGTDALEQSEKQITAKLAVKAVSPAYINFQREPARRTVAEFANKWLVTQTQWKDLEGKRIRVLFADEPIESLGPQWLPQIDTKVATATTR